MGTSERPEQGPAEPPDPVDAAFEPDFYLSIYPDIAAARGDPLEHYKSWGWRERRRPAAWFDPAFYLERNPDVAASHMDPLRHFLTLGWQEARDPSAEISIRSYLSGAGRARGGGMESLLDYVRHGGQGDDAAPMAVLRALETDPSLRAQIDAAAALDPEIGAPGERNYVSLPELAADLEDAARQLRLAAEGRSFAALVLVGEEPGPSFRDSLVQAVAERVGAGNVLLATLGEPEGLDGIPTAVVRLPLDDILMGMEMQRRVMCLFDLIRGVGCRFLVDAGSAEARALVARYGRQLAASVDMIAWGAADVALDWPRLVLTEDREVEALLVQRFGFVRGGDGTTGEVLRLDGPDPAQQLGEALARHGL